MQLIYYKIMIILIIDRSSLIMNPDVLEENTLRQGYHSFSKNQLLPYPILKDEFQSDS